MRYLILAMAALLFAALLWGAVGSISDNGAFSSQRYGVGMLIVGYLALIILVAGFERKGNWLWRYGRLLVSLSGAAVGILIGISLSASLGSIVLASLVLCLIGALYREIANFM